MVALLRICIKVLRILSRMGFGRIPGMRRLKTGVKGTLLPLLYGYLPGVSKPIDVLGNKMYIGSIGQSGVSRDLLFDSIYERVETDLFQKVIRQGMVVIDVGANIGYYTLIAAKGVGGNGKVYAFEPEPNNNKLLVQNINANNYANVIVFQKAASNCSGVATLYLSKWSHDHSFSTENVETGKDRDGRIEVETVALDEVLRQEIRRKVNIVKIDAEGAELLILKGMQEIIRTSDDLKVFVEFWPYGERSLGSEPSRDIVHLIQSSGFQVRLIDDAQGVCTIRPEQILEIAARKKSGKGSVNVLLEKQVSA